jgi:L-iditol 2-dehydrogenase
VIGVAKLAAGAGNVALAERPERAPRAGEVTIAVAATGVCGTDLHIEAGEYTSSPPVTLGHEVAGTVAAVGPDVDSELIGARVVTETIVASCGHCGRCREGRANLCRERCSIGTHADGGFAARVVVPVRNLHRVPDGVGLEAAALAEPLACVCQCMLDPHSVGPGDRVLVIGPGPMGALAAQVARAAGGTVTVAGLPADAERLAVVAQLGLATTTAERLDELEPDVVVEASGSVGGVRAALAAVRHAGTLVQVGIFGRDVEVPLDDILFKELSMATGFASTPRAWRRALALLATGAVRTEPLVTEVAPLHDFARVFADLRAGRGMKVLLAPGEDLSGPLATPFPR